MFHLRMSVARQSEALRRPPEEIRCTTEVRAFKMFVCSPLFRIIGMYGPPQNCKRKIENDSSVCANVFGLWWSQRLLAMMESARSLPY